MLARTTGVTPSADNEEWIQELFLSCETIRIVVASRDRIRWDRKDADWKAYLNQHLLDNLSVEDSRWFLEQVPIREPEVIDTIVDHAGGVPLYLDMCVDIYEAEINEGKALDFSSLQKGEKIIDRYIRHLDQKDKYAVRVLSIPRSFNVKYAMRLLEKQKLLYSEEELLMLCDKSVILSLDEAKGLWKVDESVRLHLRNQMRPEKIREILGHMMECIAEEDSGRAFPYFATILEVVSEKPEYLEQIEESVLEEVDYYANAGYWKEMHAILASETENSNPRLQAVAVMEELIYLRRTGRLAEAEQFGASHPLRKETMGAWYYMYRYLLIQIRHLQGHYEESLREYKALVDEMEMIRAVIPLHIYVTVCMKYADLLFLRGEFDESLALVENLQKEDGVLLVDRIELLRIEGHIYRFLNQFEQAELIYRSAVKLMADNGLAAYEGKLCNNMVEALCRTEPQEAMEWFEKSKDINEQTENEIELGKSYAAASIAQTKLGDTDQAIHFSQESIRISELTGYKSGRAFGLLAMCLAYKESGDVEKLEEYRAQLRKQLDEIGVYLYIYKEVE
jgi:tetratricopeptide (TPR) repeat protein